MIIKEAHLAELKSAVQLLENPGIAAKITNLIGMPIEKGMKFLPDDWNKKIGEVTQKALMKAANIAIFSINSAPRELSSDRWHKLGVAVTGGIGGFLGLPAMIIELPVSTTIMLRSIAEIARREGEHVNDSLTKLACLEVFALGGKNKSDDSSESGYFVVRAALARSVSEAAQFAATKSLTGESAPALIRFIVNIAQRFSIQVTEKAAAQAIPVLGAAGGAIINTLFIDHFQDMAKGHFVVRRLEGIYGKEVVRDAYEEVVSSQG
ncbi:MAG TPA: EcsC family protein [Bacteroidales bacterium]|nr:EcsC family protein [Bacteroidales bacterium]